MLAAMSLLAMAASPAERRLSDADLMAIEKSRFDKAAKMGHRERPGTHNGVAVLADYPCSDLCPSYTTRIPPYDLAPGAGCRKAGGVMRQRAVPIAIAVELRAFCVPRAIAGPEH